MSVDPGAVVPDDNALLLLIQAVRDVVGQELKEFGQRFQEDFSSELRRHVLPALDESRPSERQVLSPQHTGPHRANSQRFLRPTHSAELDAEAKNRAGSWRERSISKDSVAGATAVQITAPRTPPSGGSTTMPGALPDSPRSTRQIVRPFPLVTSHSENSSVDPNDHNSNADDVSVHRVHSPGAHLRVSVLSTGGNSVNKRPSPPGRRQSLSSTASRRSKSSIPRHQPGILPVVPGHVPLDSGMHSMSFVDFDLKDESSGHLQSFLDPEGYSGASGHGECSVRAVARSAALEYIICFCIFVNGLTIGLETEYDIRHVGSSKPRGFTMLAVLFTVIYIAELALRIGAEGTEFFISGRSWNLWNVYDIFVVMCCLASVILERFDTLTTPSLSAVVLLRLLRLSRILRLIKLCRSMVPLILWTSIVTSMRYMIWVILLLLFVIYVGGVLVTTLVADHGRQQQELLMSNGRLEQYYSSLGYSVLSLFQAMTGGVDWDDLIRPLMTEISPAVGVFFSLYICFSVLCVSNVITGIFVDSALESARDAKGRELQRQVLSVFGSADADGNGTITWSEFAFALGSENMEQCFKAMDIDPSEARGIFTLLDTEDRGEIDCQEFVAGCLRLRGQARAIDLATLMYFNKRIATWWFQKMQLVEDRLEKIIELLLPEAPKAPGRGSEASVLEDKDKLTLQTPAVRALPSTSTEGCKADGGGGRRNRDSIVDGSAGNATPGASTSPHGPQSSQAPSFFATWTELKAEADRRMNDVKQAADHAQHSTRLSRQRTSTGVDVGIRRGWNGNG